jgi:hypothetical protein
MDSQHQLQQQQGGVDAATSAAAAAAVTIERLQHAIEEREEEIFDLQATVATIQSETEHELVRQKEDSASQIRTLQDELRRTQLEVHLARLQAKQQQQQDYNNAGTTGTGIGSTGNPNPLHSRLLGRPPTADIAYKLTTATTTKTADDNAGTTTTMPSPVAVPFGPNISGVLVVQEKPPAVAASSDGQRLLRHVLRQEIPIHLLGHDRDEHDRPAPTPPARLLSSFALMASSSVTSSCPPSELDVVWLIISEIDVLVAADAAAADHDENNRKDDEDKMQVDGSEAVRYSQNTTGGGGIGDWNAILSLLRLLYQVLLVSHAARTYLAAPATSNNNSNDTTKKKSCLRVLSENSNEIAAKLQAARDQLSCPLYSATTANISEGAALSSNSPTELQLDQCHRFVHEHLLHFSMSTTFGLSMTAIDILHTLNIPVTTTTATSIPSSSSEALCDIILHRWIELATILIPTERPTRLRQLERWHCNTTTRNNSIQVDDNNDGAPITTWTPLVVEWMVGALSLLARTLRSDQSFADSGRADSLMACLLDVLEHICLPADQMTVLHPPLALACVHFLVEAAAARANTDDFSSSLAVLIRTRHATTRSTTELWHFAASSIGVAARCFHRVVLVETDGPPGTPVDRSSTTLRNSLVRLFHVVLRYAQEHRRQWELSGDKNRPPTSFLSLISEYKNEYLSAAATLLTEDDLERDVQAMLRLQMDEVAEDQEEILLLDLPAAT